MRNHRDQLWDDVLNVWQTLQFTATDGAYAEGEYAAIHVVVVARREDGRCDLEVEIAPYAVGEGVDPAVLEGARAAFEEAREDPNPGVRANAQDALRSLEMERVRAGDMEGLALPLRFIRPSGLEEVVEERTNRHGRALFRNVPEDALCAPRSVGAPVPGSEAVILRGSSLIFHARTAMAALSGRSTAPDLPQTGEKQVGGGRLVYTLYPSPDGTLMLRLWADAPELRGRKVALVVTDRETRKEAARREIALEEDLQGFLVATVALPGDLDSSHDHDIDIEDVQSPPGT